MFLYISDRLGPLSPFSVKRTDSSHWRKMEEKRIVVKTIDSRGIEILKGQKVIE